MVGGHTVAALRGVATRTYTIFLASFLCDYCQAFSPYVLLAFTWCIHIAVSIRPLLGKMRFILSVRSDFHMTDNLSIAVDAFATHVLLSVSVDETLLPWYVNLSTCFRESSLCGDVTFLIKAHVFLLVCVDMEPYACGCSLQIMLWGFILGGYICLKRYVIGVVHISNYLCGVSSASFLC